MKFFLQIIVFFSAFIWAQNITTEPTTKPNEIINWVSVRYDGKNAYARGAKALMSFYAFYSKKDINVKHVFLNNYYDRQFDNYYSNLDIFYTGKNDPLFNLQTSSGSKLKSAVCVFASGCSCFLSIVVLIVYLLLL